MRTDTLHRDILASIANTRDVIGQADAEGRALRGEFGLERQLRAMSAQYLALRAEGRLVEAAAIKAEALRLYAEQQ